MVVLRFVRHGEQPARFATTLEEIAIGSAADADLVLADSRVGATHARLVHTGGAWLLHPGDKVTYVNAVPARAPTAIAPGDTFIIGPFILSIERDDTSDEELRLLAALAANDDEASRAVYADWLEQHGHENRAEFLRAQVAVSRMTPVDAAFPAATARVRELARSINVEWRMRISRPAVEDCKVAREFTCGVDWAELAPTEDPKLRTCTRCRESVHYCTTETEAIDLSREGRCVVVDFASWRSPISLPALARAGGGSQRTAMPGMHMPMTHLAPIPPASNLTCPQCGQAQTPSSRWCSNCGTRIE